MHSCGDAPSVVAVCAWAVRGRQLDWRRSLLPGNPRCCCVRVCQSPVLTRGSGGRRACSHWLGGCRCRRWPRMKVMYERVAGIDVHKDMIKVAIRSPGDKPWTRKTEILEYRTFYGVLQEMARELRRRGVAHVVMEASGVYTEPVYYALCEQDFTEIVVVNPAHAKALKGHKTDAKDCARLAELFECGLLHGSYIPAPALKEVRDLARYRIKTVQARTSEIQRLAKALESAGTRVRRRLDHYYGTVRQRDEAAPRCELLAARSMVVAGAGTWSAQVGCDHPMSARLLHGCAALRRS